MNEELAQEAKQLRDINKEAGKICAYWPITTLRQGDALRVGRHPKVYQANYAVSDLSQLLSLALRSGDELLWTQFIHRSQPVIAGVVIKTVRRWGRPMPSLVDDLVQETYLKLFAAEACALRRFVCRHENSLHGFLKVVTANTVQDHLRRCSSLKRGRGREEDSVDATGGKSHDTRNPAMERTRIIAGQNQRVEHHIMMREIDAHLKQRGTEPSSVRDYKIFWFYYREGLTAKAISCIPSIGLTVKGVESSLLRLTRFVRLKMSQQQDDAAL